jgi:acyl-CoA synthetase (AMP-forming)/AMP-acid ligase II
MTETCPTLIDLLRERADKSGDRLAFSFLVEGSSEGERLTFRQLDEHARHIAGWLRAFRSKGERPLLLFPAGLDFLKTFFGCFYAGLIPIPAPAPEASRRKRTVPRLRAIAHDAQVAVVLLRRDRS